jgi:hypothetical protein
VRFTTVILRVSESNLAVHCRTSPFWDSFSLLYGTSFDATAPLKNLIVANDDLVGNASVTGFSTSRFSPNQQLVFVLTGYSASSFGASQCTFTSSGTITIVASPVAARLSPRSPCSQAVASEQAVLDAAGLSCLSIGASCAQADFLSPCHVITLPYLVITAPSLSSIVLPELVSVGGSIYLGQFSTTSFGTELISFPKLIGVAGIKFWSLQNLTSVNLDSLTNITNGTL